MTSLEGEVILDFVKERAGKNGWLKSLPKQLQGKAGQE